MADIELVIKIPEGLKKDFELEQWTALSCMEMKDALEKATPLPKGHGKLKDADEMKRKMGNLDEFGMIGRCIDEFPTIIESDNTESKDKS